MKAKDRMAESPSRQLPRSVRAVEVLGSWDDFKEAYPLQKDRQAGSGHWRGCHSFRNITCDGSSLDPSLRRDGGLKMGGTYWYYYRLDGEVDYHDPIEPSTTACPLLPGQQVNVLEVPIQYEVESNRYGDVPVDSNVFTLDPNAKYNSQNTPVRHYTRPDTFSAAPTPSLQLVAKLRGTNTGTSAPPATVTMHSQEFDAPRTGQGLCLSFPTSSSLMTRFHKLRGNRSAPAVEEKLSGSRRGPLKILWRRSTDGEEQRHKHDHDPSTKPSNSQLNVPVDSPDLSSPDWILPDWPPVVVPSKNVAPWNADLPTTQPSPSRTSFGASSRASYRPSIVPASLRGSQEEGNLGQHRLGRNSLLSRPSCERFSPNHTAAPSYYRKTAAALNSTVPTDANASTDSFNQEISPAITAVVDYRNAITLAASPLILPIQSNTLSTDPSKQEETPADFKSGIHRPARPPSLLYDDRETLKTLYTMTPSVTGQLSPHYLSQSESPSIRDFGEAWDSESQSQSASQHAPFGSPPLLGAITSDPMLQMPQLPSTGFQGYSLPEADHASQLTLRKPSTAVFTPVYESIPKSDSYPLVESWNNGSDRRHMTTLDELVYDLGYLGQIIG
ncbi:MAG: hypothetical protein Q9166_005874 [cf. Caloplaca sp. 2 TL-2023]